jgi:hypothetical protein
MEIYEDWSFQRLEAKSVPGGLTEEAGVSVVSFTNCLSFKGALA